MSLKKTGNGSFGTDNLTCFVILHNDGDLLIFPSAGCDTTLARGRINNARSINLDGNKVQLTIGGNNLVTIQFSDAAEAKSWKDNLEETRTRVAINLAFREFLTPIGTFFLSLSFNKDDVSDYTQGIEDRGVRTVDELATKDERFLSPFGLSMVKARGVLQSARKGRGTTTSSSVGSGSITMTAAMTSSPAPLTNTKKSATMVVGQSVTSSMSSSSLPIAVSQPSPPPPPPAMTKVTPTVPTDSNQPKRETRRASATDIQIAQPIKLAAVTAVPPSTKTVDVPHAVPVTKMVSVKPTPTVIPTPIPIMVDNGPTKSSTSNENISALNATIRQLENEVQGLTAKERADTQSQARLVSQHRAEIDAIQAKSSVLTESLARLKTSHESEVAQLQSQLSSSESRSKSGQKISIDSEERCRQLQKVIEDKNAEIAAAKESLSSERRNLSRLTDSQAQLERSNQQSAAMQSELSAMRSQLASQQSAIDSSRKSNDDLQRQLAKLREDSTVIQIPIPIAVPTTAPTATTAPTPKVTTVVVTRKTSTVSSSSSEATVAQDVTRQMEVLRRRVSELEEENAILDKVKEENLAICQQMQAIARGGGTNQASSQRPTDDIAGLRATIGQLQNSLSQKNVEAKNCENAMTSMISESASMEKKLEEVEMRQKIAEDMLLTTTQNRDLLQRKLDDLERQYAANQAVSRQSRSSMEENVKKQQDTISNLQIQLEESKQQVKVKTGENTRLVLDCQSGQMQISSLSVELVESRRRLEDERSKLPITFSEKSSRSDEANVKALNEANHQVSSLSQRLKSLENQLEESKSLASREKSDYQQQIASFSSTASSSASRIVQLGIVVAEMTATSDTVKTELTTAQKSVSSLQILLSQSSSELLALKARNDSIANESTRRGKKMEDEISSLSAELSRSTLCLSDASSQFKAASSELMAKNAKLDEFESLVVELRTEAMQFQQSDASKQQEVDDLNASYQAAVQKLSEETQKRLIAEKRLADSGSSSSSTTGAVTKKSATGAMQMTSMDTMTIRGAKYWILDNIGSGGSSVVFKVLSERNVLFALKLVDFKKIQSESQKQAYKNEIALLKRLTAENCNDVIVELVEYETFETENLLAMIMELGEIDLKSFFVNRAFNLNLIRWVFGEMLNCVCRLHEKRIVHADLKPQNFLFVKGRLKLIDFGISQEVSSSSMRVNRDDKLMGTINYMSPESIMFSESQASRRPRKNDNDDATKTQAIKLGTPADIWALGCILCELAFEKPPLYDLSVIYKIARLCDPNYFIPVPPESFELPPGFTEEDIADLVDLVNQCIVRTPAERPSAMDLQHHAFFTTKHSSSTINGHHNSATVVQVQQQVNVAPTIVNQSLDNVPVANMNSLATVNNATRLPPPQVIQPAIVTNQKQEVDPVAVTPPKQVITPPPSRSSSMMETHQSPMMVPDVASMSKDDVSILPNSSRVSPYATKTVTMASTSKSGPNIVHMNMTNPLGPGLKSIKVKETAQKATPVADQTSIAQPVIIPDEEVSNLANRPPPPPNRPSPSPEVSNVEVVQASPTKPPKPERVSVAVTNKLQPETVSMPVSQPPPPPTRPSPQVVSTTASAEAFIPPPPTRQSPQPPTVQPFLSIVKKSSTSSTAATLTSTMQSSAAPPPPPMPLPVVATMSVGQSDVMQDESTSSGMASDLLLQIQMSGSRTLKHVSDAEIAKQKEGPADRPLSIRQILSRGLIKMKSVQTIEQTMGGDNNDWTLS